MKTETQIKLRESSEAYSCSLIEWTRGKDQKPEAQWWPDLYLRKGRKLVQIQPHQCGPVMDLFRGDRGFSEMPKPSIDLFTVDGEKIGHVSYNGRVWLHDIEGNVEIPIEGMTTAAQRESEGWE